MTVQRGLLLFQRVKVPPTEMLRGGGEDIVSIVADVNRWSAPCRS